VPLRAAWIGAYGCGDAARSLTGQQSHAVVFGRGETFQKPPSVEGRSFASGKKTIRRPELTQSHDCVRTCLCFQSPHHEAFAQLRRYDGKTVETCAAAGGDRGALRSAVRHG